MLRHTLCAALAAILGTAGISGQGIANGEIGGRITDVQAFPLPGVRVTVSLGDERKEAFTDGEGRFVVRELTPGAYRVVAELAGFVPESGTIDLSPTGQRAHVEWSLRVGCLDEAIHVIYSVSEAAPLADAIVHVRVESGSGPVLWSVRPECGARLLREYIVQVVSAAPGRSGAGNGSTLQILVPARDAPLEVDGEYLALLWRTPWRTHFMPGARLVFPIVAGRVVSPTADALNGMRIEEAMALLREWSQEGRR